MDQLSWPFGADAIPGQNPFGGESQVQVSWMGHDSAFEPQGTQTAVTKQ